MKIIVGLGNPGKSYQQTRHNTGFLVLDRLQKILDFPKFQKKEKLFSEISEGTFGREKILLVKPQTFMNESGKAVSALMKFYKISPENMWVVYDDVDLIEGTFRIRPNGSAGTHNGMKSIVSALSHENFPRFRMGIAKEKMSKDIVKFILSPMTGKAWKYFQDPIEQMAKVVLFALEKGITKTMDTYN